MRGFLIGVIFAALVLIASLLWYTRTGRVDFTADQTPSSFERWFAGGVSDASVERHAPNLKNPVPPTAENIVAGAQLYLNHCAGCHGTSQNPESQFARSFNPPVPCFFKDSPDMPENQNFYIIEHGIRWTGMPAWGKTLNQNQIWQIVTFLSSIPNLPPAAQKVLAPNPSASPPEP
ncbi:MAG TPA: c-type cytochrome [Candidatus Cybelea sp.]|nr:c-type cytochrome [Candidatus Cybelea sp.]